MNFQYKSDKHSSLASSKWDAIIVGSGLGGMTTGCLLAKAGKRVLILERHTIPGGFTHTFKRKGFEWDVGVHYVGQVKDTRSIIRKVFDYVTDSKLKWEPMGEVYDQAIIAGDKYNFVEGTENQALNLIRLFPTEEVAIRKYLDLVRATSLSAAYFIGEKTMPYWMSRTFGRFLRNRFEKMAARKTIDVIREITQNEKLIAVLCAQCGDYGLAPTESSFGIHAIVIEHYLAGACYPVGGASQIHESILSVFEENGGSLVLNAEVKSILVEKGRALGVELKDGQKLFAPVVVSNVGFRNTYERLLPENSRENYDAATKFAQVAPSTAHVCLYVGMDASDAELSLPKNNIWVYEDYDFEKGLEKNKPGEAFKTPLVYISFPSAKDPMREKMNGGRATIQVIAACDYDLVSRWKNTPWKKRGEEYEAVKEEYKQKLMDSLIKAVPQIAGRVAYAEISTPLSTEHFMNYSRGEIYGLEHTPNRFALHSLRPRTKIRGLFLTGQDIVTVGVGGALYSGVLTATAVLKKSVIIRILFNLPLSLLQRGNRQRATQLSNP